MKGELPTIWLGEYRIDGEVVSRIGRRGDEFVAEFASLGKFVSSARGACTYVDPAPNAPSWAFQKLRNGLFDALLRHVQGKITFHGSAVASGSRAIAFVGPGGAGKSTLAAAFCVGGDVELVADDTVPIELATGSDAGEPVQVVPAHTATWLFPDARAALGLDTKSPNKTPIGFGSGRAAAVPLAAVVDLVFDPEIGSPVLRRLRGQDAFRAVSNCAIRFVIDDATAQTREFDQLRFIVERCPIFELRRPRDLGKLHGCTQLLRGLLAVQSAKVEAT